MILPMQAMYLCGHTCPCAWQIAYSTALHNVNAGSRELLRVFGCAGLLSRLKKRFSKGRDSGDSASPFPSDEATSRYDPVALHEPSVGRVGEGLRWQDSLWEHFLEKLLLLTTISFPLHVHQIHG